MADAPGRYPGYDVLDKRGTPSWNEKTRAVVEARLATPDEPRFFSPPEWAALQAACDRLVPQSPARESNGRPIPVAALVDAKLEADQRDGYRDARLPPQPEAWRRGLRALDAEAEAAHGKPFAALPAAQQDELLHQMEAGKLHGPAWDGMPPDLFFKQHLLRDALYAYYSHPTAWSEIGFGGPAAPRGYVRLQANIRDPWDAVEAHPGDDRARIRTQNRHVR